MTPLTCANPASVPPNWPRSLTSRQRPAPPGTVLTALFAPPRPGREEAPRPAPGPRAQGKTVFASVCRPAAQVITDAFAEADRRDPGHARPWITVIDGNCHQIETVSRLAAERGVKAKILIDLIHVVYLWKAANSLFYPGDPEACAWVREQTAKILAGKHRDVRAGISEVQKRVPFNFNMGQHTTFFTGFKGAPSARWAPDGPGREQQGRTRAVEREERPR